MTNYSIPLTAVRIVIMGIAFLAFYGILIFKLWCEQIKEGEAHREKISKQSIRKIRVPAVRGRIFTSDKHIVADSAPSYKIMFHPDEMRQPGRQGKTVRYIYESAKQLSSILKKSCPVSEPEILRHLQQKPFLPITVFEDLGSNEIAMAAEMSPPIQGIEIAVIPKRFYPDNNFAAHIIGYIGKSDPKSSDERAQYPDMEGRSGIERKYDTTIPEADNKIPGIRGNPGRSLVRVNHMGYVHEIIDTEPATAGNDIVLTIDYKAQKIAEKLIAPRKMAFVLLDADSGAVLAMASSPSVDLNTFVPSISKATWKQYNDDPAKPLINKAVAGEYAPGSIIKPLIALAALTNGRSPNEEVQCNGYSYIGNAHVKCWAWERGGHGNVNLLGGIEQSCNCYFIAQGRKVGLDAISSMLETAGIGQATGFPLAERTGLLPSREYKMKVSKEKWTEFDTAILSIGQGMILITPLQAALYTAAIANGGTIWKPYLLKDVLDAEGQPIFTNTPSAARKINTSEENIMMVQKGMWMVVNAPLGSGKTAKNQYITLCGKTGTAEVGPKDARYKNTWFIAFGRFNNKTYAVSVFADHGESGGRTCAPVAREFFNQWLANEKKVEEDTITTDNSTMGD